MSGRETEAIQKAYSLGKARGIAIGLERAAVIAGGWADEVLDGDETRHFGQGARWASKHIPTAIRQAKEQNNDGTS